MSGALTSFALRLAALGGDLRGAVTAAARLGYSAVALDVVTRELDLTMLSVSALREVQAIAARHAVGVSALWLDLPATYLGPKCDLDQLLARVRAAAETARGLNASAVVVQLGLVQAQAQPSAGVTDGARGEMDKALAAAGVGLGGFGLILPTPEEVARLVQRPRATGAAASPPAASSAEVASLGPVAMRELAAIADHYRLTVAVAAAQSPCLDLAAAVSAAKCKWLVAAADTLAVTADGVTPEAFLVKASSGSGEGGAVVVARDGMVGPGGRVQEVFVGEGHVAWTEWAEALRGLSKGGSAVGVYDPTGLADRLAASRVALARMREGGWLGQ